jgi:hypothetical protein
MVVSPCAIYNPDGHGFGGDKGGAVGGRSEREDISRRGAEDKGGAEKKKNFSHEDTKARRRKEREYEF